MPKLKNHDGRGSALLQVLIMSLMMAILAAGLARLMISQYQYAIEAKKNMNAKSQGTALVNEVMAAWSQKGGNYCDSFGSVGCYVSTRGPGSCSCGVLSKPGTTSTDCNCVCFWGPNPSDSDPCVQAAWDPVNNVCGLKTLNFDTSNY